MKKITWKKVLILLIIFLLYNIISNAPDSIKSFNKGREEARILISRD